MPVDNSGQEAAAAAVDELLDDDEEEEVDEDEESDLLLLDPLSLEELSLADGEADLLEAAADFESERESVR